MRPKSDTSELECNYLSKLAGECEEGWECKKVEECPAFKEQESNLKALTTLSPEWSKLVAKFEALKCKGENNLVCCKRNGGFDDKLLGYWEAIVKHQRNCKTALTKQKSKGMMT